jgi:hypothetical protein
VKAAKRQTRRRWWASVGVGALACLAACVGIPTLAAAGIAGGGLLLAGAKWAEPVGFGLIIVGVAGLVVSRIRARRHPSGESCSGRTDGSACACDQTHPWATSSPNRLS